MSRYSGLVLFITVAAVWSFSYADGVTESPKENLQAAVSTSRRVVATAAAVDCYSCVSCPHVTDHTTVVKCPPHPNISKVKKCIKYAEKYPAAVPDNNVSWVIRGCASERGSCEDLRKAYLNDPDVDLQYCTECEGDRCNGVSRSLSDAFFAFFAVIIVPMLGKYILS